MSDLVRIHNPNPVPVIYDRDGHQVDGHASVLADLAEPLTADLLASGRLIIPSAPKPRFPIPPAPKSKSKPVKEESTDE